MADKILLRRGAQANLPTLDVGEPGFTTDTEDLYIGGPAGNVLIGGSGSFKSETLTYTDPGNEVIGPLTIPPSGVTDVNLFVFNGILQEYTVDYTVREVSGGSAPGFYICVSPSSSAPGGGSFLGGFNPGTGIASVLSPGDTTRVMYAANV